MDTFQATPWRTVIIFFYSFIFFSYPLQLLNPPQYNLSDLLEIAQDEEALLYPEQVSSSGWGRRPHRQNGAFQAILSLNFWGKRFFHTPTYKPPGISSQTEGR